MRIYGAGNLNLSFAAHFWKRTIVAALMADAADLGADLLERETGIEPATFSLGS